MSCMSNMQVFTTTALCNLMTVTSSQAIVKGVSARITSAVLHSARGSFMMVDPVWMQPLLLPCVWVLCIHMCQVLVGM